MGRGEARSLLMWLQVFWILTFLESSNVAPRYWAIVAMNINLYYLQREAEDIRFRENT